MRSWVLSRAPSSVNSYMRSMAGAWTAYMSRGNSSCCRKRVTKVSNWWIYVHFGSSQRLFLPKGALIQQHLPPPGRQKTQLLEALPSLSDVWIFYCCSQGCQAEMHNCLWFLTQMPKQGMIRPSPHFPDKKCGGTFRRCPPDSTSPANIPWVRREK